MHHSILILIMSLVALLWAANHLITGSASLAHRTHIPPFIIGLTLVAIGTSIPDLALSVVASLKNDSDLTIGNAIGTNIANIGLVLGLTILLKPTTVNYHTLKKTYPILIIAMLFVYSLILDGYLGKIDGCLFLIACITLIGVFIYLAYQTSLKDPFFNKFKSAFTANQSLIANIGNITLGVILLPICAKHIVLSAAELARGFGVDPLTINLTIQAIGTTLPELSTALLAAFKNEEDLAIGTILGANIYNLLLILAFPTVIASNKISTIILWRDLPIIILLALFLLFLNYNHKKKLSHWHGGVLVMIYCSYIASLIIRAHA